MFVCLFVCCCFFLSKDFGKQGDPEDVLSRYHANVVGDAAEGRAIWDDVMTRHGAEAAYWMDYVAYLRCVQEFGLSMLREKNVLSQQERFFC